ncbi:MAG TPA: hypothetical protein PKE01_12775 [Rhodocyclaceae bacterium]|nr:hypothetical protein [Rhodocyclaceae bacterium]HMZ56270.1 hypothetical protein [Nitrospira sp.]HNI69582.1 hypothetical protein [Nitrospira sp.]
MAEDKTHSPWTAVVIALIGALASVVVAWITANQKAKEETAPLRPLSIGSLVEGQKLCSIFVPNMWRDNMIIPKTWTSAPVRFLW